MTNQNNLLQLEKLLNSRVLISKLSGRWLTKNLSNALKHLPEQEGLINSVFKQCVILMFLLLKSQKAKNVILSMLEFPLENSWMIFLDKLSSCPNQNTLTTLLFKILLQELILKEKDCRRFWTPAFKELSEMLSLPIRTDYQDLDSIFLKSLSIKQEEISSFLIVKKITNLQSKNYQKTCCQSFISSTVGKWERDPTKLKTLKIKIYPTKEQKKTINEFIDTSRYVYNKTLEYVNNGYEPNKFDLQSMLVTKNTKLYHPIHEFLGKFINDIKSKLSSKQKKLSSIKSSIKKMEEKGIHKKKTVSHAKSYELKNEAAEISLEIENLKTIIKIEEADLNEILKSVKPRKNPLVLDFELFTPKDIRDCAVQSVCDAMQAGFTNLARGNIRYFNMKFKKKTGKQTIEITPKLIKIENGKIMMCPSRFDKNENYIKISKRNTKKYRNLKLNHNCDLQRVNGEYFLYVPIETNPETTERKHLNFCGVDPGLRTFLTTYNQDGSSTEYKQNNTILFKKLNEKIKMLKSRRERKPLPFNYVNKRYKKKQFSKIEKRKKNLIDSLHWSVINDLIKKNDVIFFGDIKSHNIVKNGKNTSNNIAFNDLKFYQFKQRLLYKASIENVLVKLTNESYTSKTCSSCGTLHNIGASKLYDCKNCFLKCDRDTNAAKNILMKGLLGENL